MSLEKLTRPGRMCGSTRPAPSPRAAPARALVRRRVGPAAGRGGGGAFVACARPGVSRGHGRGACSSAMVEIIETHGGGIEARVGERSSLSARPRSWSHARRSSCRARDRGRRAHRRGAHAGARGGRRPGRCRRGIRRPCARGRGAALARVRGLGLAPGILSGDHARVVAAVGAGLGLAPDMCRGGVSPRGEAGRRGAAGSRPGGGPS